MSERTKRYFLKADFNPDWTEVTREQWIKAERAAGFHPKYGDGEATGGFGGAGVSGRITTETTAREQT